MKQTTAPRSRPATSKTISYLALALLLLALAPRAARAQWTTDTTNTPHTTYTMDKVGVGTASPEGKLHVTADDAAAGGVTDVLHLAHTTTGTPAAGIGAGIIFEAERSDGNLGTVGAIQGILTQLGLAEGGDLAFVTRNSGASSERMRILANGNVGIGTASPDKRLTVVDGVSLYLKFLRSSNDGLYLSADGDYYGLNAHDFANSVYKPLTLGWGGQNVYLARTGGNVGVGTASPLDRLHVDNPGGLGAIRVSGSGAAVLNLVDAAAGLDRKLYQWKSQGGVFRLSLLNDTGNTAVQPDLLVANSSGHVGVGTADGPDQKFGVQGLVGLYPQAWVQPATRGMFMGHFDGAGNIYAYNYPATAGDPLKLTGSVLDFGVYPSGGGRTQSMVVANDGKVGIGVPAPMYKLDVAGDVHSSGAITGQTVTATYQDVAEWVPSSQKLSAGTVVVLDTNRTNHVLASTKAYDTGVAGVISDSPGVILGQGGDDKVKVATTGRVKVKVDATRAPIRVGDLLVTSEVEGVAMRSVPVDLGGTPIHRPGTIIGKALEPLEKGTGEILVLLSLQ